METNPPGFINRRQIWLDKLEKWYKPLGLSQDQALQIIEDLPQLKDFYAWVEVDQYLDSLAPNRLPHWRLDETNR